MANNFTLRTANGSDAEALMKLINEMYGLEYEKRDESEFTEEINSKNEIYIMAYQGDECVGFSGASINNSYYADLVNPDVAVIDYIYTKEDSRSIKVAYELLMRLLNELISVGIKSAIMEVQTFNKQRFFHYALSDKDIIKSSERENKKGKYEDQILLIKDIRKVATFSMRELMSKAVEYFKEENATM